LAALLKGRAEQPHDGLCLVTTRQKVADLDPNYGKTAEHRELERLDEAAGADWLAHLGVKGPRVELRGASAEVRGHALTLRLLGTWLAGATPDAEIRRRREVRFEEADAATQGGHAFKVIAAYERWL